MAAQSSVTLNTKVYTPRGRKGDIASWVLQGDTTFGGANSTLSESVRYDQKAGVTRVHFKLDVPKGAEADSACGCIGTVTSRSLGDFVISVPDNLTAAERLDYKLRLQAMVAHAIFTSAVSDREAAW